MTGTDEPPAAAPVEGAPPGDPLADAGPPREPPAEEGVEPGESVDFAVMDVLSISVELPSQFPLVTLQEAEPPFRQLTMPIGLADGVALAHAFRKIATPRPLTHELLVSVFQRFNVDVVAVRLVGRRGGTYLAELDLVGPLGHEVVSCRPSDGLALSLRLPIAAPLLADERLLDEQGDVEA